ncbi:MAG: hypothetical protein KDK50_02915 [Chlamydiia bacterium]|nr:hypothetical protein [Chlamydiia bacterium]MCP5491431.1 hypothetical protein [Chlamydiales bacterium]
MCTLHLKILLVALCLCSAVQFAESVANFNTFAGTQEGLCPDFRIAKHYQRAQVTMFNLRGTIASTNGMYTPNSSSPFIAGNFGLVHRWLVNDLSFFGAYGFFGEIYTPYHNAFSRLALGLEYQQQSWRYFLNTYLPIGSNVKQISSRFKLNKTGPVFSGHSVDLVDINQKEVMSPYGLSLGIEKTWNSLITTLVGSYYEKEKRASRRLGGSLDFRYQNQRWPDVIGSVGYDSFYEAKAYIGLSFKLGQTYRIGNYRSKAYLKPVYLEDYFWTQRSKRTKKKNLLTSAYYVNNARSYPSGFLGNGSFESPFLSAALANQAISSDPNAVVYFFQGNAPYSDFGTFNLFGSQSITGQGGNWFLDGTLILPGAPATRPFLARTMVQETLDTPLITVSNSHLIENIGLINLSSNVATGGSMITNLSSGIDDLSLRNVVSTDKLTLIFSTSDQIVTLTNNDIYGADIKATNGASINLSVTNNTFRTNETIAVRFNQQIAACLFMESLNNSNYIILEISDNQSFNTVLDNDAHLGLGFLSSGNSTMRAPNGFLRNSNVGALLPNNAGAFLFQGVDTSRVEIDGCFDNASLNPSLDFVLQNCDIDIKKAGFAPNATGLSQANNGTTVSSFASVNIFNSL